MTYEQKITQYFISVVIPAFNEEKYLSGCLESLNKQDYPRDKFEVIVVDNNSVDKTPQIAQKYGAKLVRCQIRGVSVSRQAGSKVAKGEIIAGTDADTMVSPNWLSIINKYFQDPQVAAITGVVKLYSAGWLNKFLAELFPIFVRIQFLLDKPGLSGANFAIRKEVFDKIGGFDTKFISAEDIDLGIRASKEGKVLFTPDLKVATSARRIEKSRVQFFIHHARNIIRFTILKKEPRKFENIR